MLQQITAISIQALDPNMNFDYNQITDIISGKGYSHPACYCKKSTAM